MKRTDERVEPLWADRPGIQRNPLPRIAKVTNGPPSTWTCLSTRIVGVYTHWVEARGTVPCTGSSKTCITDHKTTSQKWAGWLAVTKGNGHYLQYLHLTESAVVDCPMLLEKDRDLRGLVLNVGRTGDPKRGRMHVAITPALLDKRRLLAEPDVRVFLFNLWGPYLSWARKGAEKDGPSEWTDPRWEPAEPFSREGGIQ